MLGNIQIRIFAFGFQLKIIFSGKFGMSIFNMCCVAKYLEFNKVLHIGWKIGTTLYFRIRFLQLIDREHVTLELARRQPAAALLGVVSEAVAACGGEVFVERFNLTRNDIASGTQQADEHVVLDVASRPGYDINQFAAMLRQPPFAAVSVTATKTAAVGGVERKIYAIECLLE